MCFAIRLVYKNIFYRKLQIFSTWFECRNFQCNSSVDLVRCIEESTYSRDEALVHASVGFDARCHVIIFGTAGALVVITV